MNVQSLYVPHQQKKDQIPPIALKSEGKKGREKGSSLAYKKKKKKRKKRARNTKCTAESCFPAVCSFLGLYPAASRAGSPAPFSFQVLHLLHTHASLHIHSSPRWRFAKSGRYFNLFMAFGSTSIMQGAAASRDARSIPSSPRCPHPTQQCPAAGGG